MGKYLEAERRFVVAKNRIEFLLMDKKFLSGVMKEFKNRMW